MNDWTPLIVIAGSWVTVSGALAFGIGAALDRCEREEER